jgi:dolichol kinase
MQAAAGAAVFALAFGDGAAALLTPLFSTRHKLYREKTLEGSLLCLIFAALGILLLGVMLPSLMLPPLLILGAAVLTTVLELFTGRYDNPAILFGVAALCLLFTEGGVLC